LELLLKPLTVEELEGEAEAWLSLLKSKVHEISTAAIAVKYKKKQIGKVAEVEEALDSEKKLDEALEAAQQIVEDIGDVKSQLLENLDELREQRKAIIDRLNLVITSYEAIGSWQGVQNAQSV
jgi:small conductance mechanosensitive channel